LISFKNIQNGFADLSSFAVHTFETHLFFVIEKHILFSQVQWLLDVWVVNLKTKATG